MWQHVLSVMSKSLFGKKTSLPANSAWHTLPASFITVHQPRSPLTVLNLSERRKLLFASMVLKKDIPAEIVLSKGNKTNE
jgi:hypothetical protein